MPEPIGPHWDVAVQGAPIYWYAYSPPALPSVTLPMRPMLLTHSEISVSHVAPHVHSESLAQGAPMFCDTGGDEVFPGVTGFLFAVTASFTEVGTQSLNELLQTYPFGHCCEEAAFGGLPFAVTAAFTELGTQSLKELLHTCPLSHCVGATSEPVFSEAPVPPCPSMAC